METVVNSEVNRQHLSITVFLLSRYVPLYFIEGVDVIVDTHF